jgi:O-antigen ligase
MNRMVGEKCGDNLYLNAFLSMYMFALVFVKMRSTWEIPLYIAFIFAIRMEIKDPMPAGSRKYVYTVLALLAAFVLLNFLSALIAYDAPGMEFSNRQNVYFKGVVFAVAIALGLRTWESVDRFVSLILAAFGIWMCLELFYFAFNFADATDGNSRLTGYKGINPNIIGMQLAILLSFYLARFFANRNRWSALIAITGTTLGFFLLFLTGSRNSMIAVLLITVPATFILSDASGNLKKRFTRGLIIFFILAFTGSLYWAQYGRPDMMSLRSIKVREIHWQAAGEVIKEGPWYRVVIGQGSIKRVLKKMHSHRTPNGKKWVFWHAHNTLLQVLLETGLLGCINLVGIWLMIVFQTFSSWKNNPRRWLEPALLTAMLSIAFMGLAEHTLWDISGMMWWMVVGLSLARIRLSEQEKTSANGPLGDCMAGP